ncbi:MAG: hypothetical protein JNJ54_35130 [Myxococcaceae bacterium]|nr:hypothetical protein [Myxococcaceae bacterium]
MSALLVDQPAPVQDERDNPAVWPLVMATCPSPELLADMAARDQVGRERYGVPLRVWNGRDALADAYQEGLDLVVYLEQCRQRVEPSTQAWDPYHPSDVLASVRNEVLGILAVLRRLQGKVPVQQFRAHADSPTVTPP